MVGMRFDFSQHISNSFPLADFFPSDIITVSVFPLDPSKQHAQSQLNIKTCHCVPSDRCGRNLKIPKLPPDLARRFICFRRHYVMQLADASSVVCDSIYRSGKKRYKFCRQSACYTVIICLHCDWYPSSKYVFTWLCSCKVGRLDLCSDQMRFKVQSAWG